MYKLWTLAYGLLGINWMTADSVREKIWVWKGINNVKKHVSFIPLIMFWVAWEERNKRAFEGMKVDFGKVKDKWLQTLGFLIKDNLLYSFEDLGDLTDTLIDI